MAVWLLPALAIALAVVNETAESRKFSRKTKREQAQRRRRAKEGKRK